MLVEVAGRVLSVQGAPPLPEGAPVTLAVAREPRPGALPVEARLLTGSGAGAVATAVRLAAAAAPAVLGARPGPALPASLSPAGDPARSVEVAVRLAAPPAGDPPPPSPRADPSRQVAAAVAALADGRALAALVLPRPAGERVRLAAGGLEARIESAAVDLPEGAVVGLRLAEPGTSRAEGLLRALAAGARHDPDPVPLERWAPDVRLAGRLAAAAAATSAGRDDPGAAGVARPEAAAGGAPDRPEAAPVRLFGEPERQAALLVLADDAGGREGSARGGDGEEAPSLAVEVAFGRLGRVRLEAGGGRAGRLRLALRSERPLPPGAADALRELAGAAFELGGRPACFLALVGPLPPAPPPRLSVKG